jgi:hypothetical protein
MDVVLILIDLRPIGRQLVIVDCRHCFSLVHLTESAAEWRAGGPSIRAARSAAAGGWNARPDADSVQPTAQQYPSIPHRAGTPPLQFR